MILLVLLLFGVASCSRDTRPLDVRIKEALIDRLEQYDVKGASSAVILPDGSIHRIAAGLSHDTVAMHPDMLFAIGSITKNAVASLVFQPNRNEMIQGKDNVSRVFTADTSTYIFQIKDRTLVEMTISDSVAYTVNSYYYTCHKKGNAPLWRKTKNVHLWRKDHQNEWKLYLDIWNSDTPILFGKH